MLIHTCSVRVLKEKGAAWVYLLYCESTEHEDRAESDTELCSRFPAHPRTLSYQDVHYYPHSHPYHDHFPHFHSFPDLTVHPPDILKQHKMFTHHLEIIIYAGCDALDLPNGCLYILSTTLILTLTLNNSVTDLFLSH